jgi:signal transduction histidine kinase
MGSKELELEKSEKIKELEKVIKDLEGKIGLLDLDLARNVAEQKESAQFLIRRDLELNRANEKLQKFDEIQSNFISVVAHQLRTPLSGVKWILDMFLEGDLGSMSVDQKSFLEKAYQSNNRMIDLVNSMLIVDRAQYDKKRYEFKYFNLSSLVESVIFELSSLAAKKGVSIKCKYAFDNLPKVYADTESIRAVFQNLLENSVKYVAEEGKVEINVKSEPDKLIVSVSDNGFGIPKSEQDKLFTKFFRASNIIKHDTDSSGLGLYISKHMIEKNGGTIRFESTEDGGSTFYFTIPTKPA